MDSTQSSQSGGPCSGLFGNDLMLCQSNQQDGGKMGTMNTAGGGSCTAPLQLGSKIHAGSLHEKPQ